MQMDENTYQDSEDSKNPFSENDENIKQTPDETENQSGDEVQENAVDEKFEELNNKYIRLAADFDNFRKRTTAEKEELSTYTTVEILKKLSGALDTFDRAEEHLKNADDAKTVKEGYEAASKQLRDVLSKIGLVEIEALGKPFNPEEHEAITQVETEEFAPDTVALVAQKGYKFKDKIVRPALVGVAKEKE